MINLRSLLKSLSEKITDLPIPFKDDKIDEGVILTSRDIDAQERDRIIDKAAQMIVKRGLTTPALLFIELAKPINFLGSQLLVALDPFVSAVLTSGDYRKFSILMEEDENVELLLQRIEMFSSKGETDARDQDDSRNRLR